MTTSYVSRDDALALAVQQRSPQILQLATQQSVAMNTFRKVPVRAGEATVNLLDSFPTAKWLTATPPDDVDIVKKPTTTMKWKQVTMYIEEAATMVVIPENVLDDSAVNLWAEVESKCSEAIARLIDQTCFFGTAPDGSPVPATFPVGGLVQQAIGAGHQYVWGTNDAAEDLGEAWNQTMALVEADGFDVNRAYADRGVRVYFRGLRDKNGGLLYGTGLQDGTTVDSVYGVPISYVMSGIWDKTKALAVMGDTEWAVLGLRQALTAKRLDQATIGDINLAEQDALGLRLKIRLGFQVLVPKGQGQSATPYPFAVLGPKAP